MKTQVKAKANKEREKLARAKLNHAEKKSKVDAVLIGKGADHTKWCGIYLKNIFDEMKIKDNCSFPTSHTDLLTLYIKWKG